MWIPSAVTPCALCGFRTDNLDEFRRHMTDTHGWGEPARGDRASTAGAVIATCVSGLAFIWLLAVMGGMGFVGYRYTAEALARIYLLLLLGVAAVIGFDLIVVIGIRRRWRYFIPAAAVSLAIAGVCLFVAGTTRY
jgi:hypothetical protein